MKRKLRDAALLSLLIFLLFACKKEPDPCESYKADFKMYVLSNGGKDTFYLPEKVDTLYYHPFGISTTTVYFKNNSNFASDVNWKVGGDVRTFTEPNFLLRFNEVSGAGERIDVELRTKRPIQSPCFPNDGGLDTVRKSFFLANALVYQQPQLGRFKGYIKGQENDTFTVNIELYQRRPNVSGYYVISNFPKGATQGNPTLEPKIGDELKFFGRYFLANSGYGFQQFNRSRLEYCIGYAQDDHLFIEYKHSDGNPINFVGVRQ